jgi:hypothetical protein
MKKYITLVYLAIILIVPAKGQQFTFHSNAPFGIQPTLPDSSRQVQEIFFYDYDDDGDLDLFLTGLDYFDNVANLKWINIHFFIQMQENTGDRKHPQFGARQDIFQQFPYPVGYFFATGGDLNDDHKMDIITAADIDIIGDERLSMLINTGLSGAAQFQITKMDEFGLDEYVAESLYYPYLVDLDGDGDLDLMTSGFNSAFAEEDGPNVPMFNYARNAGDIQTPQFEGWYPDPYGLSPHPSGEILTAGDINNDGHMDFLGALINIPADSINPLLVHLNTPGPNSRPTFTNPLISPFGLPVSHGESQLLFPTLVDLDGDHDLDMFVFKGNAAGAELQYYENNLCQSTSEDLSESICAGGSIVLAGVEYSQAGVYTITLENSQHCDSIIQLTLIVDPIPTVSIETMICDGDSYTVGNETFSNPGAYMIHLTTANGCDSIVLLTLEVDIVDPSVFVNENVLMAAQSGATYQWFDCDAQQNIPGATNQTYVATVTGNYQVYVTDGFGCTVQSMCLPIIISAVDPLIAGAINLYPNPASDIIYVANSTPYTIQQCSIFDLTGHVIAKYASDGKTGINVSDLSTGVYMWSTKVNGQSIVKKLVILD